MYAPLLNFAKKSLLSCALLALAACGGGGYGGGGGGGGGGGSAPSALTYMSPATATVGTAITALSPTVTGSVTSYSVSPALPAGLSLNTTSGAISGTPTAVAAQAMYTITAMNSYGSTPFALSLTVNPAAPSALTYTSPVTATVGTAITPLSPTVTGTVSSYSVSPALPAGLSLNTMTGVISGTPTATATQATYTIKATNVTGNTPFGWVLTVNAAAAAASQTAIFSDAAASGLAFTANPSGTTGTTDTFGQFKYAPGDSVTFSAAGITLGTAAGLSSTSTSGNPSTITPINLVPGAVGATDPTVTAIGQLLAGLNSVAVSVGQGNGGTFVIPTATGLTGTAATTVTTLLNTLNSSGVTASTLAAALSSGGAVQTAIAAAGGTVPTAASAQANITQGVNAASIVGTLWTAPCAACNGGAGGTVTLIFNPDGVVRGFGAIDSNSTGSLIGTWQASTSSTGGASYSLISATAANNGVTTLDGSYVQGTLSGASGTAQIYNSSGVAQGAALAFTESSSPPNINTTYLGAWKISVLTDTNPGSVSGGAQSIFAIFEANGSWYLSEARNAPIGTWNLSTGVGTIATTANNPTSTCGVQSQTPQTGTVNLAAGTFSGTNSSGTVTRAGLGSAEILDTFYDNAGTLADAALEVDIPLSLNVNVSWPANTVGGGATSALVLGVALTGPGNMGNSCNGSNATKLEAFGLRPEINSLGNGAVAGSTPDTITFGYVKTQAANYQVSVLGPQAQYCSVTQNGSGPIVDANSGNAAAYPTVQVVCIGPAARFAYVANAGSANISAFSVNASTGALSALASSPVSVPASSQLYEIKTDPTGRFLYAVDQSANKIFGFSINSSDGSLTAVTGSPFATGTAPQSLAFDSTGLFVYVSNSGSNNISAFSLNSSTGVLAPLAGSPYTVSGTNPTPNQIVRAGNHLYVTDSGTNSIDVFSIAAGTGALTEGVAASPFATGTSPYSIAVDPSGQVAYVANAGSGTGSISAFAINPSTGVLTPVAGNPLAIPVVNYLSIDSKGKFLFATETSGVVVYPINATTGVLGAAVAGSPFTAGTNPYSVRVDQADRFVYVGNDGSANVSEFTLNSGTGVLTPVAASPVATGTLPDFIATD